jgi:TonB family protein
MKNSKRNTITLLFLVLGVICLAGEQRYEYGRYMPSIKKEKLISAKFINEIMPEFSRYFALPFEERSLLESQLKLKDHLNAYCLYPTELYGVPADNYSKVIYFTSIEISAICNGKVLKARSENNVLTGSQKNLLYAADLGTNIHISIKYKYKYQANVAIDDMNKVKEGVYSINVVPEKEAEYPGGYVAISDYLNTNVFNKIPGGYTYVKMREVVVQFSISEEGKVTDVRLLSKSKDPKADKLLVEAISKMPAWNPAIDSKGKKVSQEYLIPFNGGGGC